MRRLSAHMAGRLRCPCSSLAAVCQHLLDVSHLTPLLSVVVQLKLQLTMEKSLEKAMRWPLCVAC